MIDISEEQLRELTAALENAVALRKSGEGGGHAALIQALNRLGHHPLSSLDAERIAQRLIGEHQPSEIRFPVVYGEKTMYPLEGNCPICNHPFGGEEHPMAIINAGALARVGPDAYSIAEDAIGFFTLTWHAHGIPSGDRTVFMDIADLVQGGQFDLYFCSTQCMRAFFNRCVDALEDKMANDNDP